MKKILSATAAVAIIAGFSTSAFSAASDATDITINAAAEDVCYIKTAPVNNGGTTNVVLDTLNINTSTVVIDDFIDDTTAELNAAEVDLNYADSYCNYAHSISMQSANGGLDHTTGQTIVGGTFIDHVNYTASATMGAFSNTFTTTDVTNETSVATSVGGANRADLVVNIQYPASSTPVLAGQYTDTLTVQIGAAL